MSENNLSREKWEIIGEFCTYIEDILMNLYQKSQFSKLENLWFALFNKLYQKKNLTDGIQLKNTYYNEFDKIFFKFESKLSLKNWIKKLTLSNEVTEIIDKNKITFYGSNLLEKWEQIKPTKNLTDKIERKIFTDGTPLKIVEQRTSYKKISESLDVKDEPERLGNIKVLREYDYDSGFIRFKVIVQNESAVILTNITAHLDIPEVIKIVKILPKECDKKNKAVISNLAPNGKQSIDFYLEPLICGQFPIEIYGYYKDPYNKRIEFHREPKYIQVKCPPVVSPENISQAAVLNLYENHLSIKQIRSFIVQGNSVSMFQVAQEAISNWGGKVIGERTISESPFESVVYFFRITKNIIQKLNHQEQIVIRLRISEANKVGDIQIRCELQETAIGVISRVWELILDGFKQRFGIKLRYMSCPECGAPIKDLDFKENRYKCDYCNKLFLIT